MLELELASSVFPVSTPSSSRHAVGFLTVEYIVAYASTAFILPENDSGKAIDVSLLRRNANCSTGGFRPAKSSTGSRCLRA